MGAEVASRAVAITGADQVIVAGQAFYRGFALLEMTDAARARVMVYDHPSTASGTLLDVVELDAGQSVREWYGAAGILAEKGIYISVTGDVDGSIRVG